MLYNIYCHSEDTNTLGPAGASSGLVALVLVWLGTWWRPRGFVVPEQADSIGGWSLQTLLHIGLLSEELLVDVHAIVLQDAALHCLFTHSNVTSGNEH